VALSFTMKQHDTRPLRSLYLTETDPADASLTRAVDLTNASSAKLLAKLASPATSWSSVLAFSSPRTSGVVVYTPVAGDTAVIGQFQAEVEITWSDGGVETYPNDGYITLNIVADLG
jgi:hypothetical protein